MLKRDTQQNAPEISVNGKPIPLFENFIQPTQDVFDAAEKGVKIWNADTCVLARKIVNQQIVKNEDRITDYKLSNYEAGAIVYWTISAETTLKMVDNDLSLFKKLNQTLITRDQTVLKCWQPFLYFLIQGLNKVHCSKVLFIVVSKVN